MRIGITAKKKSRTRVASRVEDPSFRAFCERVEFRAAGDSRCSHEAMSDFLREPGRSKSQEIRNRDSHRPMSSYPFGGLIAIVTREKNLEQQR
jgi:hypothetical protein